VVVVQEQAVRVAAAVHRAGKVAQDRAVVPVAAQAEDADPVAVRAAVADSAAAVRVAADLAGVPAQDDSSAPRSSRPSMPTKMAHSPRPR